MSIEEFGQSLLNRQRDINRRRERDAKKQAYLGLGLTVAKKFANTFLEEQTRKFMEREDYQSARQVARGADRARAFELDYTKRVKDSGKTEYQYELELAKPIAQQFIQEQNPLAVGKEYDALVNEMAATVAKKKLGLISEMRNIVQQGPESYSNRLDLIQKRLRPSNIEQGVTSFLRGMVDGMSNEDMELRQLAALKEYSTPEIEGPTGTITLSEAEQAKRLNSLMDMYGRTRNLTLSTNYADNEAAAEKISQKINKLPTGEVTKPRVINVKIGGEDVTYVLTVKTDQFGSETITSREPFDPNNSDHISKNDIQVAEGMAYVIQNYFNEPTRNKVLAELSSPVTVSGGEGQEDTVIAGMTGLKPRTPQQLARFMNTYIKYAQLADTSYKKDTALQDNINSSVNLVTSTFIQKFMQDYAATINNGSPEQIRDYATRGGLLLSTLIDQLSSDPEIGPTETF